MSRLAGSQCAQDALGRVAYDIDVPAPCEMIDSLARHDVLASVSVLRCNDARAFRHERGVVDLVLSECQLGLRGPTVSGRSGVGILGLFELRRCDQVVPYLRSIAIELLSRVEEPMPGGIESRLRHGHVVPQIRRVKARDDLTRFDHIAKSHRALDHLAAHSE
jgi:hypothetical protein